jgi:replicative DNA helicase
MDSLVALALPQSLEAEQSVLGAALLDKDALLRVSEFLKPEDFYKEAHRQIYETMIFLYEHSNPVDLITVTEELRNRKQLEKVGGVDYLQSLMDVVPASGNAEHYARIIVEKSLQRKLIQAGHQVAALGFNADEPVASLLDRAEHIVFSITQGREQGGFSSMEEILTTTFEHIEQLYSKKNHVTGISSGFRDLDELTAGFQNSDLIVVAARPSMGKTSFCLNIAVHAAVKEKVPVAIFSIESSKEEMALRMLCSEAWINAQTLRTGNLKTEDWQKLSRAMNLLSQAPIFIDDTGALSVLEIRSKARRLKQEHKNLGLIIIDHLQLIRGPKSENKVQEIAEISRGLKFLAKELNVPVIVVSQLNREVEKRTDKRPMLSDLRESGAIEQDSDLIMFIYRDEYYNPNTEDKGVAEIIVAKQRNGPVGTIKLGFWKEFTKFKDDRYLEKTS